jgi:hypothetical protein
MSTDIHLSELQARKIDDARQRAREALKNGDKQAAIHWNMYALKVLNQACIEALEDEMVYPGEAYMYSDITASDMGKHDSKDARHLDLYLVKGSPLYNDILAVLKKHLNA